MLAQRNDSRLYDIADGTVRLSFHSGQSQAWESSKRFVFVLAGTQGGKTCFGPWWLWNEVLERGPGDYLAVTASYDLFKLKMLPELRDVFEGALGRGRYWADHKVIELPDPQTGEFRAQRADDPMWGRIILRSAQSSGGLEAATAEAAWLDECGQDGFTLDNWEAVLRRLSLSRGRVLGTTTLYNLGWLKSQIYDAWAKGHPDIDVVQFPSTANPGFPRQEYERARREMPAWKFKMFYEGQYDRPAGLIYSSFDDALCVIEPFLLPGHWPRYVGIDFGAVHTAALFFAEDPSAGRLYAYREYLEGEKTAAQHAASWCGEAVVRWVGGSESEGQWRREFRAAGIPIMEPPIRDVEVGIDRVYGCHARNQIRVFRTLGRYLDEKGTYCRALDPSGTPTERIAEKERFHLMDAERYVISWWTQHKRNAPRPHAWAAPDDGMITRGIGKL